MKLSAFLPFYNNQGSVLAALHSLDQQDVRLDDLFALDDGSTDCGAEPVEANGFRCLRQPGNLGRGAARYRAMQEAMGELVVCCDATNVLPPDFVRRLLPWFEDPQVAAVYGRIQDRVPRGAAGRWRARHLFKQDHPMQVRHHAPLITYGTLLRRSAVLAVGNFDPALRHSEDAELGERLLAAGYDIIFDPSVPVICNVTNTLGQVLERYWRWYAGKDEKVSWHGYWRNCVYAMKFMAFEDLRANDPVAALISLLCPHHQFWRSVLSRTRKFAARQFRKQPIKVS
jgi:GT2 family glycosyltransferase